MVRGEVGVRAAVALFHDGGVNRSEDAGGDDSFGRVEDVVDDAGEFVRVVGIRHLPHVAALQLQWVCCALHTHTRARAQRHTSFEMCARYSKHEKKQTDSRARECRVHTTSFAWPDKGRGTYHFLEERLEITTGHIWMVFGDAAFIKELVDTAVRF